MEEQKDKFSQVNCKHCGWIGKHLLHHLRHNKLCMQKEDVNELRRKNEEKRKFRKRKYQNVYNQEHKEQNKKYYQENREVKINYQKEYDEKNKKKRRTYDEQNKEKQKAYQKKYYQENKQNKQVKKNFLKYYVTSKERIDGCCYPNTIYSFRRKALEAFLTPATKHMFEHSVGQGYCCEGNRYILDWNGEDFQECSSIWKKNYIELTLPSQRVPTLSDRTITAHQIDHDVKSEICLLCGNTLIKLCNINRMQCHLCYAAKCFLCKSTTDPDIYKAYQHFWVKDFNSFVPGLCSYFQNSEKTDKELNDTCASCERSDQGSKQIIKDCYSEKEHMYICNDKCKEEFTTICEAIVHVSQNHPPLFQPIEDSSWGKYEKYSEKNKFFIDERNILESGHLRMGERLCKDAENQDPCLCFYEQNSIDDVIIRAPFCFSQYPNYHDEASIFKKKEIEVKEFLKIYHKRIKNELNKKLTFEDGVYKCKYVCLRKYKYRCELFWHKESDRDEGQHWTNVDRDKSFCGVPARLPEIFPENSAERSEIEWIEGPWDWFDTAKCWVKDNLKYIITKICCCQGGYIFCKLKSDQHHNRGECCFTCANSNLTLPVKIKGRSPMYCLLPKSILSSKHVFKSYVKLLDCQKFSLEKVKVFESKTVLSQCFKNLDTMKGNYNETGLNIHSDESFESDNDEYQSGNANYLDSNESFSDSSETSSLHDTTDSEGLFSEDTSF
mgnify:CR=1 FL=1